MNGLMLCTVKKIVNLYSLSPLYNFLFPLQVRVVATPSCTTGITFSNTPPLQIIVTQAISMITPVKTLLHHNPIREPYNRMLLVI